MFLVTSTFYTPVAHAPTHAALNSCATVGSHTIGRILFEHMSRGVTAGQERHNSSNVGSVTAGHVRHNSGVIELREEVQIC